MLLLFLACLRPEVPPPEPPAAPALPAGLSSEALDALMERAVETRSDGIVVMKGGQVALQWPEQMEPIEAMSITKSVVGLALGDLLEEGKIPSFDEPAARWFPGWGADERAGITLRHLMSQTSGLASPPVPELYRRDDFVEFALALPLTSPPGEAWAYNNAATNLLPAVVFKASGVDIERYLREGLFGEMGITDFGWERDRAGNLQGMAGLQIRAADLAKIGQMMAQGGVWEGRALLSQETISLLTTPADPANPEYALLWWSAAVPTDDGGWRRAGFRASGYLGQHLVVLPEHDLVAVRLMRQHPGAESEDYFADFYKVVPSLLTP